MSAPTANPFEAAGRAAKLAKLLDAVDVIATEGGLHPRRDAAQIADSWKNASGAHFAELVKRAGIKAPSGVTIVEFFDALDHRAANPPEAPTSRQVGRFGWRDAEDGRDHKLIRELAAGRPYVWIGSLARVAGGPGWEVKRDPGGVTVVEHNAVACDELERQLGWKP